MKNLKVEDWNKKISEDSQAVVLDVRTPKELTQGSPKNTIYIDFLNETLFAEEI